MPRAAATQARRGHRRWSRAAKVGIWTGSKRQTTSNIRPGSRCEIERSASIHQCCCTTGPG
eukprot:15434258-Alexandrium_andersonii.AAC.1